MSDSFGWHFGSEWTRDRILADRLAGLESHAAATTSRLRSQLTKVQGNLEKRLDALTTAFDAYVELGDIREQLLAHADTTGSRRQAGEAFEAMLEGRSATRLDTLDGRYWLPFAVNALIAIVEGGEDPESEEAAHRLTPDSGRFIVAAAGALGRGETVQSRVADLLVGDGRLTEAQALIWEAARDGLFGPEVLPLIREVWGANLDAPDADDWATWLGTVAGSTPHRQLEWLERQTSPVPEPTEYVGGPEGGHQPAGGDGSGDEQAAGDDPESLEALRNAVTEMIGEGVGEERELLARARELRARIENPGQPPRAERRGRAEFRGFGRTAPDPDEEADRLPEIAHVVRAAWLEAAPGSPLRTELDGWVRPGLAAAAGTVTLPTPSPAVVQARTAGGTVDVVAGGPKDPKRVSLTTANIVQHNDREAWRRYAFAGGAGLCLVLAVVALIAGSTGWTVLAVIAVVGLGAGAAWEFSQHHIGQRTIREETAALEQAVDRARDEAAAKDRDAHLQLQESRSRQEQLVARLAP